MSNDQVPAEQPDSFGFLDTQIGQGLKPLAQHGAVVIYRDGAIVLFDSNGQVIDQASLAETTAKKIRFSPGTVALDLAGRKYNAAPGWGTSRYARLPGLMDTKKRAALLLNIIETRNLEQALQAHGISLDASGGPQ